MRHFRICVQGNRLDTATRRQHRANAGESAKTVEKYLLCWASKVLGPAPEDQSPGGQPERSGPLHSCVATSSKPAHSLGTERITTA